MYKSREKNFINIISLIVEIWKVKTIEKEIAVTISKKAIAFKKMAHNKQHHK